MRHLFQTPSNTAHSDLVLLVARLTADDRQCPPPEVSSESPNMSDSQMNPRPPSLELEVQLVFNLEQVASGGQPRDCSQGPNILASFFAN